MVLRRSQCVLALCIAVLLAPDVRAQDNRFVPPEAWEYTVIKRLQRRGHLLELDPTALPYRTGEVKAALRRTDRRDLSGLERRWVRLLWDALPDADPDRGELILGGTAATGLAATNNDRLDPLRPTDAGDPTLQIEDVRLYPNATLQVFAEQGPWVAQAGLHHNVFYNDDPDGLDAFHRLMARSEDAYIGYNTRLASLYLGRFDNHWGVAGEPGLILSDNSLAYDQLYLRVGGRRFALYSVVAELDAVLPDGQYTGRLGDLPPEVRATGIRRFLSTHRFNWRPSRHLSLSVFEAVLYSSPGAGFSLKYLNPLQLLAFEVDSSPKTDENNGFVGGLFWANLNRLTFSGQFVLDDFDVMFFTGEPGSLSGTLSVTYAGLLHNADLGVRATAVTARAYNTHQPEGRFIYLLRGLATQFSDYVHASAFADVYLDGWLPGLTVSPQVHVLWQGEGDIRDPYPSSNESVDTILDGTVERTLRAAIDVYYQRDPRWWIRLNVGPNVVSNRGHLTGFDEAEVVGVFSFGLRFASSHSVDLDFD